jgi:hypothetical protein
METFYWASGNLDEAAAQRVSIIQKRTSMDPRSATVRPSPTTSACWGIASPRRVAGKDSIFAAWRIAFELYSTSASRRHLPSDDRRTTRLTQSCRGANALRWCDILRARLSCGSGVTALTRNCDRAVWRTFSCRLPHHRRVSARSGATTVMWRQDDGSASIAMSHSLSRPASVGLLK